MLDWAPCKMTAVTSTASSGVTLPLMTTCSSAKFKYLQDAQQHGQ